jgi:hypothetical protein
MPERTQLTVASIVAAVVIVVAFVAMPGRGDNKTPSARRSPSRSVHVDRTLENAVATDRARGGRSSSRVSSGSPESPVEGLPSDPPVTATEVKVGITYTEDPGGANAAAGFTVGQVDQRRGWEALIADINRKPPFGRKVVPVWYSQTEDEVTSKGGERLAQEACALFTQDNRVFMVWVGTVANNETLSACLTKARVPQVAFGIGESYTRTFTKYPYFVEPSSAAMDRMATFYVDELFDAGFFSRFKNNSPPYTPQRPANGRPRVGLIRYDQPSHKAGAAAIRKRLAARGLSLCDGCDFEIGYSPDNVPEQLNDATEINAAIQGCKSRNCTHMLFLGSAAQRIPVFFMDGAERQAYRPRIGLTPLDDPNFVKDFLGPASYPQFRQSQQVTWTPGDLGVKTGESARCRQLFQDAGETFTGDEAAGKEAMIPAYCDTATYFAQAMKATGPTLSLDSWMSGVHTMPPVASAGAYVMQTKARRHDGIGGVRIGDWSEGCHCFKPSSDVIPV